MDLAALNIEDILPHQGRMRLIDKILSVQEDRAKTLSVVSPDWPLFDGRAVSAVILIELVAQTAGINNGMALLKKYGKNSGKKGWLVGIKKSRFAINRIPLRTPIITSAKNSFAYDNFREIQGTNMIGDEVVGEVTLQVLEAD